MALYSVSHTERLHYGLKYLTGSSAISMARVGNRSSRAWIFVSHSTKDIKSVRRVRNYLEKRGAHPLLFFLKCLSSEPQLRDLLRKEIDARNFFLLCDSRASRDSEWVKEEVTYVETVQSGKRIGKIDLEAPWGQQQQVLDHLIADATVFLSYAAEDLSSVNRFRDVLEGNDFAVFKSRLAVKSDWQEQITLTLQKTQARGVLIFFLSAISLARKKTYVNQMNESASLRSQKEIVVVELEAGLDDCLPFFLSDLPRVRYEGSNFELQATKLLAMLGLETPAAPARKVLHVND